MSHTPKQLLEILSKYEELASESLLKNAKKKEKKKLDPKAKVRNRGTVCVPAESAKDKKDHFPINDEAQARNALARVHQYSAAPPWYSGSLTSLQNAVSRKVHSKYPGIGKDKKKKSSSIEVSESLLMKYAQFVNENPGTSMSKHQEIKDTPDNTDFHPSTPVPVHTAPETVITNTEAKKHTRPAGNSQLKQVQTNLKAWGLTGADGKPLVLDGLMGPNTRFALQSFKTEYNMPQATDAMVMHYVLNPKQNPNAKRYAEGDAIENYWKGNPKK